MEYSFTGTNYGILSDELTFPTGVFSSTDTAMGMVENRDTHTGEGDGVRAVDNIHADEDLECFSA
jgi:hypothetical protein